MQVIELLNKLKDEFFASSRAAYPLLN